MKKEFSSLISRFHGPNHGPTPPSPPPFIFETRQTPQGRRVLFFPFVSVSDIHWGTKYSKAKKLAHFFEHTDCTALRLVGDIVDGEYMVEKPRWNFGPWHRQGVAHVIRKAGQGVDVEMIPGNHDEELRGKKTIYDGAERDHRKLTGKSIFNIDFKHESSYQDPRGRNIRLLHGDVFDDMLFKDSDSKKTWYKRGDHVLNLFYDLDDIVRKIPGLENFSIAARAKSACKIVINSIWGIGRTLAREVDHSTDDGALYGHTHMGGFQKTPGGKLIMNDGSCTEQVQAIVHDRNGTWALIEWHKDHIEIVTEDAVKTSVDFKDLDIDMPAHEPTLYDDLSTHRADRLMRIMFRLWPSKERQALAEDIQHKKSVVEEFKSIAAERSLTQNQQVFYNIAHGALIRRQNEYLHIPIPRHAPMSVTTARKLG